jgi:hypothetical protein
MMSEPVARTVKDFSRTRHEALMAANDQLREAAFKLMHYAEHLQMCCSNTRDPRGCDCGLNAAISRYKAALRATAMTITHEMVERAAKAIGRTPTELSGDNDPCDASCETDGGTCICIDLHWKQARAALEAALKQQCPF